MPGPRPRPSTRRGKRLPAKKSGFIPAPTGAHLPGTGTGCRNINERETEKKRNNLRIRLQTVWKGPKLEAVILTPEKSCSQCLSRFRKSKLLLFRAKTKHSLHTNFGRVKNYYCANQGVSGRR